MTGPRLDPSLDDLYRATRPRAGASAAPDDDMDALYAATRPRGSSGYQRLSSLGSGVLGLASGANKTVASTARKLSRTVAGGRDHAVSRALTAVEDVGRSTLRPTSGAGASAFDMGEAGGQIIAELAKYGGAAAAGTAIAPGIGTVAVPVLLGLMEAIGSRPEESEAGMGAQLATWMKIPRVARALDAASQTAAGRALVSTIMSAAPDAAIMGVKTLRKAPAPIARSVAEAAEAADAVEAPRALPRGPEPRGPSVITPNPSAPIRDPRRLLTAASAVDTPARQAAREVADAVETRRNAPPVTRRRTRAEAEMRRANAMDAPFDMPPAAVAAPEDVAAYLAGKRIGAQGSAVRRSRGFAALERAAEAERATLWRTEALPPDAPLDDRYWRSVAKDPEAAASRPLLAPDADMPRNLRHLTDEELQAAWQHRTDANAVEPTDLIPENHFLRAQEGHQGGSLRDSRLNATENRQQGLHFSEEQIGRIRELGYEPDEWVAMARAQREARFRVTQRDKTIARIEAELERRGKGVFPDDAAGGLRNRAGRASVEALSSVGGAGAGFVGGVATDDENAEGLSPLQRGLLGAALGAAGGFGAAKLATRNRAAFRQRTALQDHPDPVVRAVGEAINVGQRAEVEPPHIMGPVKRAYTKVVSETFPLIEAARAGGAIAEEQMKNAVARYHGYGQRAKQVLLETLQPAIGGLDDGQMEQVSTLLVAKRDLMNRRKGDAVKTAANDDELAHTVQVLEADPKVAQAAQTLRDLARRNLAERHAAGMLTDEAWQAIQDSEDFYTPFLREMVDDPTVSLRPAPGGQVGTRGSGVRRMDRTVEAIERLADPLEVIVKATLNTERDVARQRVANILFNLADAGVVSGVKEVPTVAGAKAAPGTVRQMRDGVVKTYQVDDADLIRLFEDITPKADGLVQQLLKGMAALKNIKTAGVTLLPDFALMANPIRDVTLSGIQRQDLLTRGVREGAAGMGLGAAAGAATTGEDESMLARTLQGAAMGASAGLYARPVAQTLRAVGHIVGDDAVYRQFLKDGASTEGFYVRTPKDAQDVLAHIRRTKAFDPKDIVSPGRWLDALRYVGSVGEQSTRLAAYKETLALGGTTGQAIRQAQDRTLRFANVGSGTKEIAAVTPFWNAKVQGWDKLGRMLKDKRTAPAAVTMLTAPTIALWSVNKDNEAYWQRPAWEKNLFWLVPKPGNPDEFYRVPKPFEIGFLFASLPERLLDYAVQSGAAIPGVGPITGAAPEMAEPGRALARSAADMAASTFEGTVPLPTALSLPGQLALDYNLFQNRPIVTDPRVSPNNQVTPESSALARAGSRIGISPEKIDFAVQEAFGTAGREANKALDMAARATGIDAPVADQVTRIPVLGRVPERFTTHDAGQTDTEAMARDRIRRARQAETDYEAMVERGATEGQITAFLRAHQSDLSVLDDLKAIDRDLRELSKQRKAVYNDRTLTPSDRRALLQGIRADAAAVAERALAVRARQP